MARIAHRFAPRAQTAASQGELQSDDYAPLLRSLAGIAVWPRALIASLVLMALLPNLTVFALLWFPGARTFWSASEHAAKPSAAPVIPMTANVGLTPPPELRPVLTAPDRLEAKAGADVAFPLELDGTDGVPVRSSIAISGLPEGARLSNGRPYGTTGWNLKGDEIGDLHLAVAGSAAVETKIRVELIAPDGEVLAGAETLLKVTSDPAAASPPVAEGPVNAAEPTEIEANAAPALASVAVVPAPDAEPAPAAREANPGEAAPDHAGAAPAQLASTESAAPPATAAAPDDNDGTWIKPTEYVNLRDGPSSSSTVVGVVPEGTKLKVMGRKRRWVQVTNPATAETGWIYGRYADGLPAGSGGAIKRPRRKDSSDSDSDESMWTKFGNWLSGS
jgi:Bacterial SH3 domain